MPWEQNERSLQVNTYVKDDDTSGIKENIQMDVKNTKMRMSIENSAHENLVSNKNQKNDNPKSDVHEEISGIDVLDKKDVIELNNQHLNEANLLPKVSEGNRNSSTFLDISSLDIVANDEPLCTSKEEKTPSTSGDSNKIKKSSKDLKKATLVVANDIPNKKFKISSTNEIQNSDKKLIDKNESVPVMDGDVKPVYSRSPSLFDDSLNLDTQMCDILEQNIIDNAHLTGLDSKVFISELDTANALQKEPISSNTDNVQLCGENNAKSIDATNLQFKNSVLTWGDDSWNNTEGLMKQIGQGENTMQPKKEMCNSKIRNIVNTSESTLKNIKTCTRNGKDNKADVKKHIAAVKEKAPQKHQLSKITEVDSPVANIIVFRKERKTSADSNKSDSDDFIIGSQHFESPFNSTKNQMRTTLEKMRKLRSQKLAEDTITENNHLKSPIKKIPNVPNIVEKKIDKVIKERKVKPKLKKISTQNVLPSPNCTSDSVIYNSEDEATDSLTRSTFKTRQYETQSNNLNKDIKSKTEDISSNKKTDLLNEMIDWNTLNIVKVAKNRVTFNLFKREVLKKRNIALGLHCEIYVENTNNIGSKICASNTEGKRRSRRRSGNYAHGNKEIRGVAISWESNIAYYISFGNSQGNRNVMSFQLIFFNYKLSLF